MQDPGRPFAVAFDEAQHLLLNESWRPACTVKDLASTFKKLGCKRLLVVATASTLADLAELSRTLELTTLRLPGEPLTPLDSLPALSFTSHLRIREIISLNLGAEPKTWLASMPNRPSETRKHDYYDLHRATLVEDRI